LNNSFQPPVSDESTEACACQYHGWDALSKEHLFSFSALMCWRTFRFFSEASSNAEFFGCRKAGNFSWGGRMLFDFARASADTTKLQWAAMYGNCLHEAREVTKGYRAAITFSILQEKRESSDSDSDSDVRASPDNVPEQDYRITFDKDFRYNCPEMEVGCPVP
jgi:hypothetical protein